MAGSTGPDIIQHAGRSSTQKRKYQDSFPESPMASNLGSDELHIAKRMNGASAAQRRRLTKKPRLVETVNSLSLDDFIERYVPPHTLTRAIQVPCLSRCQETELRNRENDNEDYEQYTIKFYTASTIPKHYFDACFALLKYTSVEAYKNSRNGWSPAKKKAEMKLPDMRYMLLLRQSNEEESQKTTEQSVENGNLGGMLSFMTTYEDGLPVLYCYEVHLAPRLQRKGVGKQLMRVYEEIGRNIGLEKAMLTVYKSNESGVKFYERLGFVEDEFSPKPMKLRNGHVKDFDYMILSKSLKGKAETAQEQAST
ncbi:conserved hypothetical protein [Uncinocarpus reesii 1704]|uniref:N-alpha-acetyltransferase 40 n=1 Tax=Uncinocarpus reesii (strain UAMH 1704) TaxID=336963 RepID=C4JHR0_UNCRE|nr:uncharacterized protein UREG_02746 [Uncinocarpus reesii 1704]EEP77897.1 conserved hypothetical protein [Uncinocarpus reesii 1704]